MVSFFFVFSSIWKEESNNREEDAAAAAQLSSIVCLFVFVSPAPRAPRPFFWLFIECAE